MNRRAFLKSSGAALGLLAVGNKSLASPTSALADPLDPASVTPAMRSHRPRRLKYHNPDLLVDLGVGLWGWPLPMDTNGIYKLFWLVATIPASVAAQERATAEAVLSSYRPSTPTLENLLKPETPPLPPMGYSAPSGAPGVSPTDYGEVEAQHTADCMDEGVLREEPAWQLPPYCR